MQTQLQLFLNFQSLAVVQTVSSKSEPQNHNFLKNEVLINVLAVKLVKI